MNDSTNVNTRSPRLLPAGSILDWGLMSVKFEYATGEAAVPLTRTLCYDPPRPTNELNTERNYDRQDESAVATRSKAAGYFQGQRLQVDRGAGARSRGW